MEPLDRVIQRRGYLEDTPALQPMDYITDSPSVSMETDFTGGYTASPLLIQRSWQEIQAELPHWQLRPDFWRQYQLVNQLGSGSFGSAYEVLDTNTKKRLVLKIFRQKPSSDTEFQVLRQLSTFCPGFGFPEQHGLYIVPNPDSESKPSYALLMDWIPGKPADEQGFTEQEVLIIGRQLLAQLQCYHQAGLVHGDIKPDNILVDKDGPLKATLIDYGSTCSMEGLQRKLQSVIQCTGCLGGHSDFWAPEIDLYRVRFGPTATPSSDLWALGLTLWLMAHPGDRLNNKIAQVNAIKTAPDSPLNNLIRSMINEAPAKRPTPNSLIESIDSSLEFSK